LSRRLNTKSSFNLKKSFEAFLESFDRARHAEAEAKRADKEAEKMKFDVQTERDRREFGPKIYVSRRRLT